MFATHFAQYQFQKKLKHLVLHVTNHCNFRCKHCFIDFSPKNDLTLDQYKKLGQEIGPLFWLDMGGGEPFLRKDLIEICGAFDAEILTIPTNGYYVDRIPKIVEQIQEVTTGELTIVVSLDGLEKTHDRIRQKGSWDKAWTTIENIKRISGVRVKVNTVICQENYDEIIPLMEYVQKRKPDFHSIILLRGDPIDPTFGLPTMEALNNIQGKIFKILASYDYGQTSVKARVLRNYHRYLWNVSLQTIQSKTQVIPCQAGWSHAVVMGNGDVSSCEMLPPIGNVKEASWKKVWQSHELNKQRQSIKNKECFCTHNCAMLTSILFRPQSLARLVTGVKVAP